MRVHAGVAEDFLEAHHRIRCRANEWETFDGVVANQVHVRAKGFAQPGQLAGMFGLIVDVREQNVFERYLTPSLIEVVAGGVQNIVERKMLSPRDELPPQS